MVERNPTNTGKGKGVNEQPLELEVLSLKTSTARLLAIKGTIERVSHKLEVGANTLPH